MYACLLFDNRLFAQETEFTIEIVCTLFYLGLPGTYIHTFPFRFTYAIEIVLPLLLVLAWILPVAMLCKNIVYEKEKRLKEVMRMMGLGNGVHWLAWFINAFVVMMFTMGLLVVLLTVSHNTIHMQE